MKQYVDAKAKYPDALLFFRMGDFYEMFFEDAELGGLKYLDLTVTSRDKGSSVPAPMSGFPHHQLPSYLGKALVADAKVAVCEQLEDASQARGLVSEVSPKWWPLASYWMLRVSTRGRITILSP